MTKDDVSIELHKNVLTIKGEKKKETETNGKRHYKCERSWGSFERSLSLPSQIKSDDINAAYKDGVLNVTVKKSDPKATSTKIEIN